MNVSSRTATNSLCVHETAPIEVLPPDTPVPVYVPPGDADVAEMQSGVRQEPTMFLKRQPRPPMVLHQFSNRHPWADYEDTEGEEDVEGETAPDAINVLSDSIPYTRSHFPFHDEDGVEPETGRFLVTMTLCELMNIRRVKTMDGPVMTILPLARHLNQGRCTYCSQTDHHDIFPTGATCRVCSSPLIKAQDEMVPYDAAVDNL
eukprot:16449631-Heterocapsa_arctica.AAC.1